MRIRGLEIFVFQKIWHALFSWNTRFQIRPFALLPTIMWFIFHDLGENLKVFRRIFTFKISNYKFFFHFKLIDTYLTYFMKYFSYCCQFFETAWFYTIQEIWFTLDLWFRLKQIYCPISQQNLNVRPWKSSLIYEKR